MHSVYVTALLWIIRKLRPINICFIDERMTQINVYIFVNMTLFTKENMIFPGTLRQDKCYSAKELLKEFHFRHRSCLSLVTAISTKAK